jgi:sialic acid synthase SpsE
MSNEANDVDINMLVAQFKEKLVHQTEQTENIYEDRVNKVTELIEELKNLSARVEIKAKALKDASKLTMANLDLYRRNFLMKAPNYKFNVDTIWTDSMREGNNSTVIF